MLTGDSGQGNNSMETNLRDPLPPDLNDATWLGHELERQKTHGVSAPWELATPGVLLVSLWAWENERMAT